MTTNKTHAGAIMMGVGAALGIGGAMLILSDKKAATTEACCAAEDPCCEEPEDDVPTISTDSIE